MSQNTTTSGGKTKIVRKRVTRMVAVLVVCFLICWFPYSVLDMVRMKGQMFEIFTKKRMSINWSLLYLIIN